jgi:hypothetical protein
MEEAFVQPNTHFTGHQALGHVDDAVSLDSQGSCTD